MAKGISLHIGLNAVDPEQYEGWSGDLVACEADAKDMAALAKKQQFGTIKKLMTRKATSATVIAAIGDAAMALKSGDFFFLTYSGHGGQVPDKNGDEPDGKDETWVLYDRMLVDDELYVLWSKFKKGVRIVVLSDSCHSGSVTRVAPEFISGGARKRFRIMPRKENERTYKAHRKLYDGIQKATKGRDKAKVTASIILISGCQDNQLSSDGDSNGLFTEKLKAVWNGGRFTGNYKHFRSSIVSRMPMDQTPRYSLVGAASDVFEAQQPFTL